MNKAAISKTVHYSRTCTVVEGSVNGKPFSVKVQATGMANRASYCMPDNSGNYIDSFTGGHEFNGFSGEETKAIKAAARKAYNDSY